MAAVMVLMCIFMVMGAPHGHEDSHAGAVAQHVQVQPPMTADE